MNTQVNFLLFLNRKIGLKIKLELSTKARQDSIEYHTKKNIFFFCMQSKSYFSFYLKNYPVVVISNCKEISISKKTQKFFNTHKSITAFIYVFENTNYYNKLVRIFFKKKKGKILNREISIFEKAVLYILDRKKRLLL
nr:hypothetical protein CcurKRNrm1_p098 [Cryptomonas curvata]